MRNRGRDDRPQKGIPNDREIARDDAREVSYDVSRTGGSEAPARPPAREEGELRHVTEAREPVMPRAEEAGGLFRDEDTADYRSRWESIQASFVDEPRRAVEEADGLVRDLTSRIAEVFTRQRSALEQQWDRGGEVSTEDLRIALQRYRDYFNRLLKL
jgi:hypothetical protein